MAITLTKVTAHIEIGSPVEIAKISSHEKDVFRGLVQYFSTR